MTWDSGLRPDGPAPPALRYRDWRSDHREHRRLGALKLSVLNTFLVFAVIPIGIILVIATLAVTGGDRTRRTRRYRPGRPYDFQPIWFLASPEQVGPAFEDSEPVPHAPQLEAGVIEDSAGARVLPGPIGGASDRW
jgi:hypothetical protein